MPLSCLLQKSANTGIIRGISSVCQLLLDLLCLNLPSSAICATREHDESHGENGTEKDSSSISSMTCRPSFYLAAGHQEVRRIGFSMGNESSHNYNTLKQGEKKKKEPKARISQ